MNETEHALLSLGLTSTETKIYLAGLRSRALSIKEIGKLTQVKRPTIYHALGTLQKKGLVAEKKKGGASIFEMSSPETLRSMIEEEKDRVLKRSHALEEVLPILLQQRDAKNGKGISVVQYDGIEGMKLVMDIAFYCRSKHWDIISPRKNFLRAYDKEYAARYLHARKLHGISARTLWEFSMPEGRRLTKEEIHSRDPRFMPASMQGKFSSMMILFDDKIAIFSSLEETSAILITSKELYDMFLAMFDGIWEFSERYE